MNEYFGLCFELNNFSAPFNEKMNFQNVSPRATLKKTAKCTDLGYNGFYFIHNICHLLFNVVDRPEVRVEMLKTNRNDVVEQSLGEVNLAMMTSLTM